MSVVLLLAIVVSVWCGAQVEALDVTVTVKNVLPDGGNWVTPVFLGFHDGSFDSYDAGLSAQPGLERISEDGDTSVITADFDNGSTYVSGGVSQTVPSGQSGDARTSGTVASSAGPPPLAPGSSGSLEFSLTADANRYLSYASMILPSNDYFAANGNPTAFDLAPLFAKGYGSLTFDVARVNDAGTEVNDFATSAGNGLFPQLQLPGGQTGPNQGADEGGVARNVVGIPFGGFLNTPQNFDVNANSALVDFSRSGVLFTITVEVDHVPDADESSSSSSSSSDDDDDDDDSSSSSSSDDDDDDDSSS